MLTVNLKKALIKKKYDENKNKANRQDIRFNFSVQKFGEDCECRKVIIDIKLPLFQDFESYLRTKIVCEEVSYFSRKSINLISLIKKYHQDSMKHQR